MSARRSLYVALLWGGLVLGACGGSSFSAPPATATPDLVLRAYLDALVRSDCTAGGVLGTESFTFGNGELCGHTTVTSYSIGGEPATPNAAEAVFATTLTTTGTADGSIQPGPVTWFYDLRRQADGTWRIAGGGSGP